MQGKDEEQISFEEKLKQTKQEFDSLFDFMNDGLFLINRDATIRKANQRAADIFGAKCL
ncbi:MAG: PAS domain-containing protein [Candidatus Heimdallarchaeota archaeon]